MAAQSLPEKRELLIAIDPVTISLLDSYELRQCGLFELIAERNSILGKVQDEFREWDYQVALLNGIQGCLTSPQLSQSLKAQLLDIQNIKQQELASRWHNLLYTSDTMRTQLSGSQWYDEQWSHSELLLALEQLNTIQHQLLSERPIASKPLVTQQEVLEKQRLLGHFKFSLDRASVWLKVVTQQLENNDDAIVCGPHRDNTKLNYLRNVFQSQYVEKYNLISLHWIEPTTSYQHNLVCLSNLTHRFRFKPAIKLSVLRLSSMPNIGSGCLRVVVSRLGKLSSLPQ